MLLIGGHALRANGIDNGREPRDIDIIGRGWEFDELVAKLGKRVKGIRALSPEKSATLLDDGMIIEWEFAWPGSTGERLLDAASFGDEMIIGGQEVWIEITVPDVLLALKLSHRYLKDSPHFWKTMADIRLLRQHGAKVHDQAWLKDRETETYARQKHPKLNVKKGDFFKGDGVRYVYDHDTIHLAVKHLERPAYTYFKPEGSDVMCDRKMFEAAPREVQLYSVLEEAYVLALERSQIAFDFRPDPRWSMRTALMKVCSSITSGWWRAFAWENHDEVWGMYLAAGEDGYVRAFTDALARGVVLPHDPRKEAM